MKAQDGKVYKNIATGEILGNEIWLGCNDSEGNYIEVDKLIIVEPIEPTPTETEKTVDEQIEEFRSEIMELKTSQNKLSDMVVDLSLSTLIE